MKAVFDDPEIASTIAQVTYDAQKALYVFQNRRWR